MKLKISQKTFINSNLHEFIQNFLLMILFSTIVLLSNCTMSYIYAKDITLNRNEVTLTSLGDFVQLNASISPNDDNIIKWTSSNESVAKVNNGENNNYCFVSAISEGDSVITATTSDGISASCEVKVKVNPKYNVEIYGYNYRKIPPNLEIDVGELYRLYPSTGYFSTKYGYDCNMVEWFSSNEEVATVSEYGGVIGHKPGTTTITLKIYLDDSIYTSSKNIIVKSSPEQKTINFNFSARHPKYKYFGVTPLGTMLELASETIPEFFNNRVIGIIDTDSDIENLDKITITKGKKTIVDNKFYKNYILYGSELDMRVKELRKSKYISENEIPIVLDVYKIFDIQSNRPDSKSYLKELYNIYKTFGNYKIKLTTVTGKEFNTEITIKKRNALDIAKYLHIIYKEYQEYKGT